MRRLTGALWARARARAQTRAECIWSASPDALSGIGPSGRFPMYTPPAKLAGSAVESVLHFLCSLKKNLGHKCTLEGLTIEKGK